MRSAHVIRALPDQALAGDRLARHRDQTRAWLCDPCALTFEKDKAVLGGVAPPAQHAVSKAEDGDTVPSVPLEGRSLRKVVCPGSCALSPWACIAPTFSRYYAMPAPRLSGARGRIFIALGSSRTRPAYLNRASEVNGCLRIPVAYRGRTSVPAAPPSEVLDMDGLPTAALPACVVAC